MEKALVDRFTYLDGYDFAADYDLSQQPIEKWFETMGNAYGLALETGHEFFTGIADRIWHMLLQMVVHDPQIEKAAVGAATFSVVNE